MRTVLTRRWLIWHLVCLIYLAVCVFAFIWQFDKAESSAGTWQNILYAIQWPIFAVMGLWGWGRSVWLHFHPPGADDPVLLWDDPDPGRVIHDVRPKALTSRPHYSEYIDPEDLETAAYNKHLRELNDQSAQEQEV